MSDALVSESRSGAARAAKLDSVPSARERVVVIVRDHGLRRLDVPVELASGDLSRYFVDGKRALARGEHLVVAAQAMIDVAAEESVEFDAVGGLTMGADQFAHAVVMLRHDAEWFSVRKAPKERGTRQRIEGATLSAGRRVLLVDDVVTRGGSILDALAAVEATGAAVVCAVTLVDRGGFDPHEFVRRRIPYRPLVSHEQLGIPAIGTERAPAATG